MNRLFTLDETKKVKGVAILLLIFHHMFYSAIRVERSGMVFQLIPYDVLQQLAIMARTCVWLFVFLSAYGLAYQYKKNKGKQTVLQFIAKHWFSLMKAYWFVFIIMFFVYWIMVKNPMLAYSGNKLYLLLDFMAWSDILGTPLLLPVFWYMAFAQILVFLMPLFCEATERFGGAFIIIFFVILQFLPAGISSASGGAYSMYYIAALLGIWCVERQLLDRWLSRADSIGKNILLAILCLVVLVGCLYVRYYKELANVCHIKDLTSSVAAFCIVLITARYFRGKWLEKGLAFLGQYSNIMFLTHTFLLDYVKQVIFVCKVPVVAYIVLVLVSLLVAFVLEKCIKWTRYSQLIDRISMKIREAISTI